VRQRLFSPPPQSSGEKKPKTEFERFDALAKRIFGPDSKPQSKIQKGQNHPQLRGGLLW
jgi:hypothetical protein